MCQLNSYFVPKTLSKDKVIELMQEAGMDCCEYMDDYESLPEFSKYNAFFSAPQRCNCGSIISQLRGTGYKSFEAFKALSAKSEVDRLEKILSFMLCGDYNEKREQFEAERERLLEKMREQSAWINEKERELTDGVMLRADISDEEKSSLLHETVYPVIHRLLEENEQKPETAAAHEKYQKFIDDNKMVDDSCRYTLEKAEAKEYPTVPLTLKTAIELSGYTPENSDSLELSDNTEEGGQFTITIPSNNIFDAIEAAKNRDFSDYISEFKSIERFVNEVLKYAGSIKLFAYWQTDDCNIAETVTIKADNFTIDSLLFLPYLTVLEIKKTEV